MEPAGSKQLEWAVRGLFIVFFAPFIDYSLTGAAMGDRPYRAVQVLHTVALAFVAILVSRQSNVRLSGVAKGLSVFLVLSWAITLITSLMQNRPETNAVILTQTTFLFVAILLSFDLLARRYSFEDFAEVAAPLAFVMLAVAAVHLQFSAVRIWGRAMYFNLHPNLGGEMLFGAIALVAMHKNPAFRWAGYALGMFGLLQLQSRAAEIATLFVIAGCEMPRTRRGFEIVAVGGLAVSALVCIGLLLNNNLASGLFAFIDDTILMKHDPFRGEGTGLVGRADTWIMALEKMTARPFSGTGLNQSGLTVMGNGIHNGFIKNLADFGVPGILIDVLILWGIVAAIRVEWRRGIVVAACAILFFFNARTISMNIFPLLLWLAILPWRAPGLESAWQRRPSQRDLAFAPRGVRGVT